MPEDLATFDAQTQGDAQPSDEDGQASEATPSAESTDAHEGSHEERALLSALAENVRVIRFYEQRGWRVLLPELRFEQGRPLFAILGKELRQ